MCDRRQSTGFAIERLLVQGVSAEEGKKKKKKKKNWEFSARRNGDQAEGVRNRTLRDEAPTRVPRHRLIF